MKADLKVTETRIIKRSDTEYIEYVSILIVDGKPVYTSEPVVVTKRLTPAQSELLELLLRTTETGEA